MKKETLIKLALAGFAAGSCLAATDSVSIDTSSTKVFALGGSKECSKSKKSRKRKHKKKKHSCSKHGCGKKASNIDENIADDSVVVDIPTSEAIEKSDIDSIPNTESESIKID